MLQTIRNAWKIADLRKKLLFTFAILLLYRLGNVIPVPFVNTTTMSEMFNSAEIHGFTARKVTDARHGLRLAADTVHTEEMGASFSQRTAACRTD